jgi:hypothetical protein
VNIVTSERTLTRCRERISRLSESTLDPDSLRHEVIADLKRTRRELLATFNASVNGG